MRRLLTLPLVAVLLVACSSDPQPGTARTASDSPSATAAPTAAATSGPDSAASASVSTPAPAGAAGTTAAGSAPVPVGKEGKPRLEEVAGFDAPLFLTAPKGDSRLYVVEQGGVVRLVEAGKTREQPFLDISRDLKAGGEQGLLSIAFSPSYAQDGHVYVDYTDKDGDTRVVEYTRGAGDMVDPASRRELLKVAQPYANHNGGLLIFDPAGMLLIGLGDGGSGGDPENRGQNMGELLGKVLRIDPRAEGDKPYRIPADNPFVGKEGVRPEIWAYGVRNPWRFSFGPDGTFYLADVGQNVLEEINAVTPAAAPGANYGWSIFEGDRKFKDGEVTPGGSLVKPALTYGHDGGACSVTGGGVYAGSVAALRGRYLYADFCSGDVWAATVSGTTLTDPQKIFDVESPASFGVDDAGEMYVVSINGPVHRITV